MKLGKWVGLGLASVICQILLSNYCSAENWKINVGWIYVDTDSIQVNPKEYQVKFNMKVVSPHGIYDIRQIVYNYRTELYTILQTKEYGKNNE